MILYLTLASCAFLAGWLVYRYDMYEREPWYMLLFAVALGAGAMYLNGYFKVEDRFLLLLLGWPVEVGSAFVAAVTEECLRLLLVMALAIFVRSQFNDPMDGIIYGCLIGLGMAIEESVSFLRENNADPSYLPPNEILRLIGHLIMGGITGFAVGMFRMRMKRWAAALAGCLLFSMLLHFAWDIIAFKTIAAGGSPLSVRLITVLLMLTGMGFFGYLVVLASEWSRQEFAPDQKHRLWGWPFTLLFSQDEKPSPGRKKDPSEDSQSD